MISIYLNTNIFLYLKKANRIKISNISELEFNVFSKKGAYFLKNIDYSKEEIELLKKLRKVNFIINKNENSKKEYQALMILIFTILLFIYYYFTIVSYDDVRELTSLDSKKKIILRYASFVGSFLILISGIIFLIIAILGDNIDTEIAFN